MGPIIKRRVYFPHNILLSCSFDTALIAHSAGITANETRAMGIQLNFAPVLDVARNAYWPRFYETFGEDPFVCASMGQAYIKALQKKPANSFGLAACAKHFIGYSNPVSGWDRTPSDMSMQTLHEFFVPPFKAAIESNVGMIMLNSGELNGQPVHASKDVVTDLLINKLNFKGVVCTDIKDVAKLVEMHKAAHDLKEATLLAMNAGVDLNMACDEFGFHETMVQLVHEGKISEARINQSVRKILQLKFNLGLFEHPYVDTAQNHIAKNKNWDATRKAAEESIVLLKNKGNLLPLSAAHKNIMYAGFAVHSKSMLNGAWTYEWKGSEDHRHPNNMLTLFESCQNNLPDKKHVLFNSYAKDGMPVEADFMAQASKADVLVITVGEDLYSEFTGNINDLKIDHRHEILANLAVKSGKPIVLVLVEGRPRLITQIEKNTDAILFAGYPGVCGGNAIARILSGQVNPSGKLSFTYPAYAGHMVNYNHKASDMYQPLYPFGHGLSYSHFAYDSLLLDQTVINTEKQLSMASLS
ncbi:MAG: hypothetical protein HC896_10615 [Bacteroidales bacterium]|nr:hypothetical protein [Bacteroidales bacterium]